MSDLARPIVAGFSNASFLVKLQLADLSNADAVRRARGDDGSSISWIIGHLLSYRCSVLQACGVDQPNPYEEQFSFDRPATDGSTYPDIAELRRDWAEIDAKLIEKLGGLAAEELNSKTSLPSHGDETLLGALALCVWHEAYHVGVIGLLRVQWGLEHSHLLAKNAMQEASG